MTVDLFEMMLKLNTTREESEGCHASVRASVALADKVTGLFFGAHYTPACVAFTKRLRQFYEEKFDEQFEIVYVSCDETLAEMEKFLREEHGQWYYIPCNNGNVDVLCEKYDVSAIPRLVIVDPTGEVITKNGIDIITNSTHEEAIEQWKNQCHMQGGMQREFPVF